MGVPTFFKWLCVRFPKIVVDAQEPNSGVSIDGTVIPVDDRQPNPNGEFDCLYLDMNGIIHPCCHPEDSPTPESEDHMFLNVFHYIDKLFSIIRPRKLLYMAIDGVAPRAKMNQQRSRRFKAAQEAQIQEEQYTLLKEQFEKDGREIPPPKEHWDSNVITPGTPFMHRLSIALHYYIHDRMISNPAWKGIKVILSDANSPGEGEHKIMAFIRAQRSQPGYDANLRHCLYGADADLIMLGLATHEAHFFIIREIVFTPDTSKPPLSQGQSGQGVGADEADEAEKKAMTWKPFQILRIPVLRDYLSFELDFHKREARAKAGTGEQPRQLPFAYDLERCIDDFVFMCFFVGNDFLPHLPSLSIHKGSIDQMVDLYMQVLPVLGDYLTNEGEVNIPQVAQFVTYLGRVEDEIFHRDLIKKERDRQRREAALRDQEATRQVVVKPSKNEPLFPATKPIPPPAPPPPPAAPMANNPNEEAARRLKERLMAAAAGGGGDNEDASDAKDADMDNGNNENGPENGSGPSAAPPAPAPAPPAAAASVTPVAAPNEGPGVVGESALTLTVRETGEGVSYSRTGKGRSLVMLTGDDQPPPKRIRTDEEGGKRKVDYDKPKLQVDYDEFKQTLKEQIKANNEVAEPDDPVQLGVGRKEDYRERYYRRKFHIEEEDDLEEFATRVCQKYAQGLVWVMKYYYQGCSSWRWFFPFHYAPFASDLAKLDQWPNEIKSAFAADSLGEPFSPFQQLMAVLPAKSGHCLPECYTRLMREPSSPLIDFYPTKFKEDPDGKRFRWQWVAMLPFIDEARLLASLAPLHGQLTDIERQRNAPGKEYIFVHCQHALATQLRGVNLAEDPEKIVENITLSLSDGLGGRVTRHPTAALPSQPFKSPIEGEPDLVSECASAIYLCLPSPPRHLCRLLPSADPEPSIVEEQEMDDESRMKGFQGEVAKRMIRNTLGLGRQSYDRDHRGSFNRGDRGGRGYGDRDRSYEGRRGYQNGPDRRQTDPGHYYGCLPMFPVRGPPMMVPGGMGMDMMGGGGPPLMRPPVPTQHPWQTMQMGGGSTHDRLYGQPGMGPPLFGGQQQPGMFAGFNVPPQGGPPPYRPPSYDRERGRGYDDRSYSRDSRDYGPSRHDRGRPRYDPYDERDRDRERERGGRGGGPPWRSSYAGGGGGGRR
ncbi:unnamed protein product [Vitrella brassicaformis CCMP3155]|uniref:Uncharacterized protein n=1 Tax=Vitrella brassicaformis (strain CCMP3155) TaxID=1169540 RepID=A0A0G4EQS0_VITBC|nr:unnamed protein product [Vitrella brassicaformis CCMP3155]|eukprot:CEL99785.1 unnamed protein product [Vitrella brassicaformis CCMP3155]